MAVLVTIIWVRPAMIIQISQRALHSFSKCAAPYLQTRSAVPVPITINILSVAVRSSNRHLLVLPGQMSNAPLITAPKAILVRVPLVAGNTRVPIFIAIIGIRPPVIVKVLLGANNPIPKAAPLNVLQFLRWCIPAPSILAIAILRVTVRRAVRLGHARIRHSHENR